MLNDGISKAGLDMAWPLPSYLNTDLAYLFIFADVTHRSSVRSAMSPMCSMCVFSQLTYVESSPGRAAPCGSLALELSWRAAVGCGVGFALLRCNRGTGSGAAFSGTEGGSLSPPGAAQLDEDLADRTPAFDSSALFPGSVVRTSWVVFIC